MGRRIMIAGSTGLVGGELLRQALADETVDVVHTLGRRTNPVVHPKHVAHVVDFSSMPALPAADELYLALGTTIKIAGSQAAFRAVDFEANFQAAKAGLAAGVRKLGLVSAMGANARSSVFYNRVKGELEDALVQLHFDGLIIARPSLLIGDRLALGQPQRPGEQWGERIADVLKLLIPANYKPIAAAAVARALLREVPRVSGERILLSGAMQDRATSQG